jgi:hypothetical protein
VIDKRLLLALASVVWLGACDDSPAETNATPGEVLDGTISDAMLPVDQVRSEPPIEDPTVFAEADEDGRPGAAAEPGESSPAADGSDDAAQESETEETESGAAAAAAGPDPAAD